ncbi:ankyrin repeat-containing protein ITN1-like [Syzygium oleosum]|uniref:ankyrin repeat-containing protein ITN1-like n=1 Tax=Syzygium oleosum TaxID=219896 RepID=UPI0024B9164B|nr:ankyrin repeat-containing protein ITN1-like [Syzygium oleosum]
MSSPRSRMSSQSSSQQASPASERRDRERRLREASLDGCVESLAHLLQEDRLILARTSVTCFDETPLHVACMLGHVHFAKALLAHKQDLTMALDSEGRTPLHLASANGYVEIARELSQSNPDACLVHDEDGRTPLHLAVMKGRSDVVRELLKARPDAATRRLSHGQTVLHLGVSHNRLETLKILVEVVRDGDLVNAQDDEGNTILHLAAANKQIETMKYLLQRSEVEVNTPNRNGLAALDIVENFPMDFKVIELRELLVHAGALRAKRFPASTTPQGDVDNTNENNSTIVVDLESAPPPSSNTNPVTAVPPLSFSGEIRKKKEKDNHEEWIKKKRNSLMIAATVIATVAYQASLSPPGGLWNEDVPYKDKEDPVAYLAGTSILAANYPEGYEKFWIYNTVSLLASLSTIFFLISGLPITKRILMWILMATMCVTITFMALTYLESLKAILYLQNRDPKEMRPITTVVGNTMYVWLCVLLSAFLFHTVQFLRIVLRIVKNPQELKEKKPGFLSWCRSTSYFKN